MSYDISHPAAFTTKKYLKVLSLKYNTYNIENLLS